MTDPAATRSPDPAAAGRRRGSYVVLAVLAVAMALVWVRLKFAPRPQPRTLPDFGPVPAFALTERAGATLRDADLRGKVWIADFIFTRCAGSCPGMSTQMRDLQSAFAKTPEVVLVSFSVDPAHDTPEALAKYADFFMARPERWFFLAGREGEVAALARGFKVSDAEVADPAAGNEPGIVHSQKFVLVDAAGKIRGYYDATGTEAVQAIVADAGALRRAEASPP